MSVKSVKKSGCEKNCECKMSRPAWADVKFSSEALKKLEPQECEIRSFVEKQADVVDRIRGSIDGGDIDKAIREAHTLKGLSGLIEAQSVTALATEIESALTAGTPDRALPLLDRLTPILLLLRGSISAELQACDRAED